MNGLAIAAVVFIVVGMVMLIAGAVMYDKNPKTTTTLLGATQPTNWHWWLIAGGIFFLIIGVALGIWGWSRGSSTSKVEVTHTTMHSDPYSESAYPAPVQGYSAQQAAYAGYPPPAGYGAPVGFAQGTSAGYSNYPYSQTTVAQ